MSTTSKTHLAVLRQTCPARRDPVNIINLVSILWASSQQRIHTHTAHPPSTTTATTANPDGNPGLIDTHTYTHTQYTSSHLDTYLSPACWDPAPISKPCLERGATPQPNTVIHQYFIAQYSSIRSCPTPLLLPSVSYRTCRKRSPHRRLWATCASWRDGLNNRAQG